MISEFLDYVRPASRLEDPIQLNNVIKEVLEMVKMNPTLNRKTTQHCELRSQKLIYGNYDKLKQAILNIMINSYQAMNDTLRPELYVQTFEAQDKVVLVIKDNGIGISKENLRKIFEPFHTTKSNGTGLGLAITHKIFEYHNANVLVESELGIGTQFTVSFPIENNPESNKLYLKKQA
ncbi:MAG: ATP-binding protein [Bdellovibrionales bacterium]